MTTKDLLYHNLTVPNLFDCLVSKKHSFNPDSFPLSGLTCFCGTQGSGKTLSAVLYLKRLMDRYPRLLCVTNLTLNPDFFDMQRVIQYTGVEQMHDIQNGIYGVVFLLDEIQIEFNSLESKQMNTPIFELVCQQRKQKKHIIGTTQVFARLAKPFREQFSWCVLCRNWFGSFFQQTLFKAENIATEDDIKTELSSCGFRFYFAHPDDFKMYDTYSVVSRVRKGFL